MKKISCKSYWKAKNIQTGIVTNMPRDMHTRGKILSSVFLNVGYWNRAGEGYIVSDECARRVEMLLGPNARACFYAWVIQETEGEQNGDMARSKHGVTG